MVFPYMDHDLAGLLFAYKLPEREIKLFTWQVLEGTEYLHSVRWLKRLFRALTMAQPEEHTTLFNRITFSIGT